ncbi:MAG: RHS repeat-associated core domain-containing protein [Acidobacteriota bacterium]
MHSVSKFAAPMLVLFFIATATAAQDHNANRWILEGQTLGRGFDATKYFVPGAVDAINTYNGNLTVTLPLGPRYILREGFDYGLTLTYNSTNWDLDQVSRFGGPSDPTACSNIATVAFPMLDANAGMGWKLSMGELYPPKYDSNENPPFFEPSTRNPNKDHRWLFVASDGSKHYFGPEIHPAMIEPPAPDVGYTTDGSFLRFKKLSSTKAFVETPDGISYEFRNFDPTAEGGRGRWRLVWIRDLSANFVRIEYPAGESVWRITDNHQREHRVEFSELPADRGEHYPRVVERVLLAGIGGDSSMEYSFRYELASAGRPSGHQALWDPWLGPAEDVSLLTSIVLPKTTAGTPLEHRETYEFAYYATYPDGLSHYDTNIRTGGKLGRLRLPTGGEQEYDYQNYLFANEARPGTSSGCGPFKPGCNNVVPPTNMNVGVRRKANWDPVLEQLGEWFYRQKRTWEPYGLCGPNYQDVRTFVFSPLSKGTGEGWVATIHYYAQWLHSSSDAAAGENWDGADFGLPFTKALSAGQGGVQEGLYPGEGKLFLSRETYECGAPFDPADPNVFSGERSELPGLGCQTMEAEYLRYGADYDGGPGGAPISANGLFFDWNRRVVARRTLTFANGQSEPQSTVHTALREWDGLGHHRTEVTAGDWTRQSDRIPEAQGASWPTRITTTHFNPESGVVDVDSPPLDVPGVADPWLLNLHLGTSMQERVDADRNTSDVLARIERIRSDACFDPQTGLLAGTRTRRAVKVVADAAALAAPDQAVADPALSSTDLLTRFEYDARGNLIGERLFGGDGAGLATSTADACNVGSADPAFQRRHEVTAGVRTETWVQDACQSGAPDVLRTLSRPLIDEKTGLVLRSESAAGLETVASYDLRGRMTSLRLPGQDHAQRTRFKYHRYGGSDGTGTSAAKVELEQRGADPAHESDATKEQKLVTGFGRLWKDLRWLPGPGERWAERRLSYYRAGPLLEESTVFLRGGSPPGETRTDYDALGRTIKVTLPDDDRDGQRRQLHTEWLGARRKTDEFWVNDPTGASERVTVFDPFGRIVRMWEPSDPSSVGSLRKTDYYYGVGGELTLAINPGNNKRWWKRDGAGLLLFERHPEIASRIVYSSFNALGSPASRRFRLGGVDQEWLTYHYDNLGRLVQTRDALRDRPLTEAIWEPGTGRLLSTKRHNWIPTDPALTGGPEDDVVVTRSFSYDTAGRVRSEQVRSTSGVSFHTEYEYDFRGNPTAIDYPQCFVGAECADAAPARRATFTYDRSQLHTVEVDRRSGGSWSHLNVTSPILYHPNGVVASMRFANQVTWLQDVPPQQIARPSRIRTEGAVGTAGGHVGDWDTGPIDYDMMGNPVRVGADRYSYDGVGRLIAAEVHFPSIDGPGVEQTSYTYDRYGNLLSVAGGPAPVTFAVDAQTNQLVGHDYDSLGNLLEFGTSTFTYDPLGSVTTLRGLGVNRSYLYDSGGERVATLDYAAGDEPTETWSLRGTDQLLLRQVEKSAGGWRLVKDFVHGGGLLASIEDRGGDNEAIRFFHPDHLGTPRLITNRAIPGQVVSYHEYLPFGWELTDPNVDNEPLQFTGHERDRNFVDPDEPAARNDDLDYMHARYYSPLLRRFLSVDAVQGRPESPQSWNRYAYVRNNPMVLVDPDGNDAMSAFKINADAPAAPGLLLTTRSGRELRRGMDDTLFSKRGSFVTGVASLFHPAPGAATVGLLIGSIADEELTELNGRVTIGESIGGALVPDMGSSEVGDLSLLDAKAAFARAEADLRDEEAALAARKQELSTSPEAQHAYLTRSIIHGKGAGTEAGVAAAQERLAKARWLRDWLQSRQDRFRPSTCSDPSSDTGGAPLCE